MGLISSGGKGKKADREGEGAAIAEFLMKLQLNFPSVRVAGAVPGTGSTSGATFLSRPLSQLELTEDSGLGSSYCF